MEAEERIQPTKTIDVSDDELSDDAIEKLLNQAEVRLSTGSSTSRALTTKAAAQASRFPAAPVQSKNSIATVAADRAIDQHQRALADSGVKKIEDPIAAKRRKLEEKKATAGPDWFGLPRTDLTPQLKRDLQVLRMRSILDPKRHYKKDNSAPLVPEFSQVGTLIEGPTEFYSSRINKKDRKRTIMESVMEGERENKRFKTKYDELNQRKRSGKKGYYKELMKKRYGTKALKR